MVRRDMGRDATGNFSRGAGGNGSVEEGAGASETEAAEEGGKGKKKGNKGKKQILMNWDEVLTGELSLVRDDNG